MKRFLLAVSMLPCLLSVLAAQSYVVDVNSGPNTAFTALDTAVAAVPNGATLLVRPGSYEAFHISGKGLTILGEPGAVIDGSAPGALCKVSSLHPGQRFAMRGVALGNVLGPVAVDLHSNVGPVILDFPPMAPVAARCVVNQSHQVHVRGLRIDFPHLPALAVGNGVYSFVDCSFVSERAAVEIGDAYVQLTDCYLSGYQQPTLGPAHAVVSLQINSRVEIRGGQIDGWTALGVPYAFAGIGFAQLDAATQVTNVTGMTNGFVTLSVAGAARCRASTAPIPNGATPAFATARATGPAGSVVALVVGHPGLPQIVAGVQYPTWLAPQTGLLHAIGAGSVTGGYAVPNATWLRGVDVAWQGLTFDAANGLQFSNAAVYVHN